jgi:Zn-dependent peptidase ImmA (M78 family)
MALGMARRGELVVRPKPLNENREFIRRAAEEVRVALGYASNAKLDLETVVLQLGGRIRYRNFWEDLTKDGSIEIRGPGDFDIFLSDATSPKRDRFTIAHELGHYFLHYPQQQAEMVPGAVMVGQRSSTGREETEAHWFAAELLMPASEFQRAWREVKGSLPVIADKFNVSTHAVAVRASSLGLASASSLGLRFG